MKKLPTIKQIELIASTNVFAVEGVDLCFSNGVERRFERMVGHRNGAVLIIPVLDNDHFLLIREYGVGLEQYTLGFPKGAVAADEDTLTTANRELMEETGYGAKRLTHLTELSMSPSYMSGTTAVIVAEDLYSQRLEGDEPEPMDVVEWRFDRIDELLAQPDFFEARNVAALLLFLRRRDAD